MNMYRKAKRYLSGKIGFAPQWNKEKKTDVKRAYQIEKGLSVWEKDGKTVVALNLKNAKRKFANMEK